MYIITLKLPDGKNYYCGKAKIDGHLFNSWDTDIKYARRYTDKLIAKKMCSNLKKQIGSENCKVEFENKFSKN